MWSTTSAHTRDFIRWVRAAKWDPKVTSMHSNHYEGTLQYLRRHIELNRLSNCSVVEAAVCNSVGWRQFDASGCHSEARLSETGSTKVPAVSIDEFLSGEPHRRPPNVMKIDARGAEMEVLCGGRRTVTEFKPRVCLFSYSEYESRQCREFLSSLGYSFEQVTPDAIWAERRG